MGSVLVPKGPRAEARGQADDNPPAAKFDRDEMIRQLFAMPLPPPPTRTRTYPTDTVLGRILRLRGLALVNVARLPHGPSARELGEHLAGRKELNAAHKNAIARGLGIDRRLL